MLKKMIVSCCLLLSLFLNAQEKYPQHYFQNPLDIPLVLAGTFGELRSNHFHSGIDIKTNGREGLNVLAVAEGYVSRIKIKHYGYGKAIYVTHPNGYTTVYGHLQKFSPKIEAYIKKQQYKKESYQIQLFPGANLLKLKKGELLAYSGNSGSSSGAHLHFEIRKTKTEKTINPLLFGIDVKDTKSPNIKSAYVYPLDDFTKVNNSNTFQKIQFTKQENGDLLADKVYASGVVGLGIISFDRLNDAPNKNGLYKLEVKVNNQKIYQHTLESFSFSESKYINLLIDYPHKYYKHERIQKCFVVSNNKLSIYDDLVNDGMIFIQDGLTYNVEIIASDIKGNKTKLKIPIIGKEEISTSIDMASASSVAKLSKGKNLKRSEFNTFKIDDVMLSIPKYTFYNDVNFNFSYNDGIASVHKASIPLHKKFTLTFDVSDYSYEERKRLFIARVRSNGRLSYSYTKKKENKFYINSKTLGNYKLASDLKKPTITPVNFKNGAWISSNKTLKVKIKDNLTGIKSYRATINNQWILMEYEPKTGILTYDFSDKKFAVAKHELKIKVSDEVNNTKTYIATFYRKIKP